MIEKREDQLSDEKNRSHELKLELNDKIRTIERMDNQITMQETKVRKAEDAVCDKEEEVHDLKEKLQQTRLELRSVNAEKDSLFT